MFKTFEECEQEELLKNKYEYLDHWTGARYIREHNKNFNGTYQNQVLRKLAWKEGWELLQEE